MVRLTSGDQPRRERSNGLQCRREPRKPLKNGEKIKNKNKNTVQLEGWVTRGEPGRDEILGKVRSHILKK